MLESPRFFFQRCDIDGKAETAITPIINGDRRYWYVKVLVDHTCEAEKRVGCAVRVQCGNGFWVGTDGLELHFTTEGSATGVDPNSGGDGGMEPLDKFDFWNRALLHCSPNDKYRRGSYRFWNGYWQYLHVISYYCRVEGNAQLWDMLACLGDYLYCGDCKNHYAKFHGSRTPFEGIDGVDFLIDLHNDINVMRDKRTWSRKEVDLLYDDLDGWIVHLKNLYGIDVRLLFKLGRIPYFPSMYLLKRTRIMVM